MADTLTLTHVQRGVDGGHTLINEGGAERVEGSSPHPVQDLAEEEHVLVAGETAGARAFCARGLYATLGETYFTFLSRVTHGYLLFAVVFSVFFFIDTYI